VGIGRAWEHLIAVDQIEKRHRLLAQRLDYDVPVIDDMIPQENYSMRQYALAS
jgi:hypothetical protein